MHNLSALQENPQAPLGPGHKSLNGTDGKRHRDCLLEKPEVQSVEANQTFLCSDPKVTVRGLGNGCDRPTGESFLISPAFAHVLRDYSVRINGVNRLSKTQATNS